MPKALECASHAALVGLNTLFNKYNVMGPGAEKLTAVRSQKNQVGWSSTVIDDKPVDITRVNTVAWNKRDH